MTFTYDLTATGDDLLVSKVRLEIGDTVNGTGVLPGAANLTDEEIQVLLDREDDDVMRATAAACELLARHWSRRADIAVGPRKESFSQVAASWREEAKRLRAVHGSEAGEQTFSIGFDRHDAYSVATGDEEQDFMEDDY